MTNFTKQLTNSQIETFLANLFSGYNIKYLAKSSGIIFVSAKSPNSSVRFDFSLSDSLTTGFKSFELQWFKYLYSIFGEDYKTFLNVSRERLCLPTINL